MDSLHELNAISTPFVKHVIARCEALQNPDQCFGASFSFMFMFCVSLEYPDYHRLSNGCATDIAMRLSQFLALFVKSDIAHMRRMHLEESLFNSRLCT